MAGLRTRMTLEVPEEIVVRLVRDDHLSTSDVFRTYFELFFGLTCCLLNSVLTSPAPTPLQWVFLITAAAAAVSHLVQFRRYRERALGSHHPHSLEYGNTNAKQTA